MKSAEQQAEEYEKEQLKEIRFFPLPSQAFIAGHHSRDEEVNKLVEVLEDIFESADDGRYVSDKAKEALKPYQK